MIPAHVVVARSIKDVVGNNELTEGRICIISEETKMIFFPTTDKSHSCSSLIFGRNGSGKSTISKAILKACSKDVPEIDAFCSEL